MYELLADPLALHLLIVIAVRARYTDEPSIHGLTFGQALVGDSAAIGMTDKQYRGAKKRLERAGLVRFTGTPQGSIATLLDSRVISLRDERVVERPPSIRDEPRGGQMGGHLSEEKPTPRANEGAGLSANEGRTRGGHGATNTELQNMQNGERGEEPPAPSNNSGWPEELTEEAAAALAEIAGLSSTEGLGRAWKVYRSGKVRFGDKFEYERFDGFAHYLRSKEGRRVLAQNASSTSLGVAAADGSEPIGWRTVAGLAANETADAEIRERRLEALADNCSWASLSSEFRRAISDKLRGCSVKVPA